MKMDEGLDTGDLLLEEKIKIGNDDNLNTCLLYTSDAADES